MSLMSQMVGVSDADEKRCNKWAAQGQELRAAVAWRFYQGQGDVLSAVSGVPLGAIAQFVKTGKIDDTHKIRLESMS